MNTMFQQLKKLIGRVFGAGVQAEPLKMTQDLMMIDQTLTKLGSAPVVALSDNRREQLFRKIQEQARKSETLSSKLKKLAGGFAPIMPSPAIFARATAVLAVVVLVLGGVWFASPAPTAYGSLKGHTVEIYRNASIRIIFSQPMNHASVEKAFRISPVVPGTFAWEQNSLTFTPGSVLEKGTKYEVLIDESAKNRFFKGLAEPYRQTFSVLDYPEVAVVAPVDGAEVQKSQRITVVFDHPIRILTGSLQVPEFLKIEPAVAGKYEWLGTSGFEFIPTKGWPDAQDITVTIPAGTKMIDGASTINDYVWYFNTPDLQAWLSSQPYEKRADPIRLSFNYPVTAAAVREKIVIKSGPKDRSKPPEPMSLQEFSFVNEKDNPKTVVIHHAQPLKLGLSYTVELPAGFTGNVGNRGLPQEFRQGFAMGDEHFRLLANCPGEGEEKEVYNPVNFLVNNPPNEKTFVKGIRIAPALKNFKVSRYGWTDDKRCIGGQLFSIVGDWQPSTTYTITIDDRVQDVFGQSLEGGRSFKVTTRPYRPSASLSPYQQQGMLAAHLPRLDQLKTMNVTKADVRLCELNFETSLERKYDREGNLILNCLTETRKNIPITGTLNKYRITDLDLDEISGRKLGHGYYTLEVFVPEIPDYRYREVRFFTINNLALTTKTDNAGKLLVWVTDLQSGEGVGEVNLEVMEQRRDDGQTKVNTIRTAKTNAEGLAEVTIDAGQYQGNYYVRATRGNDFGLIQTSWDDGIGPWNYALQASYETTLNRYLGYIYTDRLIYRSDQKVNFKGVVRQEYDAKLSLPKFKTITVNIDNSRGERVSSLEAPVSEFGTFHGSLDLNPSMPLGNYQISVSPVVENRGPYTIWGSFQVQEYRRPDFKVTIAKPQGLLTNGQKVDLVVEGAYYYGAPLAGGKVSYSVDRRALYFQPMRGEWFNYTEDSTDCYWHCRYEGGFETVTSGSGDLDGNGKFTLTLPATLTDFKSSANYIANVTVTDLSGRTVSSQLEVPVHKGEFYVGIRSDYTHGWESPNLDFALQSVNPDGNIRPNVPVTVKLYKRTYTNTKKENTDGSYFWDYQTQDTLQDSKSVVTDVLGQGRVSFVAQGSGEFVAVTEARDTRGNLIKASGSRWVSGADYATMRVSDDHHLKIIQNKADYNVGETASLLIQTPYERTKALVSIERETIRSYKVIDLSPGNKTLEIPITENEIPNVFVSVLALKGSSTDVPEFRLGYANLQVNTTKKVLNLSVTPDRKDYHPGEEVTLRVSAKNSDGVGVRAETSIAVVDERVVALLGSIDKNILGKFWFPRTIGVRTAQSLTLLVRKIFFATEGGAGGKGGDEQGFPLRTNFLDTAIWKADVVTNGDGQATLKFKLPDNLTSWQILAIGTTKDTIVGSAETSITTKKDLMVEPLLPRFVRFGDTVTIGATVYNGTANYQEVKMTAALEGLNLESPATKNVSLPPNSRDIVEWRVKVPYGGIEAKIVIRGSGQGANDGFEVKLPIHDYSVQEIVSTAGILKQNVTETLEIPDGILKDRGQVTVVVSPGIGNSVGQGIDYLTHFPYECSEQLTSKLVANVIFAQLAALKITSPTEEAKTKATEQINYAISKIVGQQRGDGGWGYWSEGSSYAHLSAYITHGLWLAKGAGFSVDQEILNRAEQYLRNKLAEPPRVGYYNYLSDDEKAQVLYVLSEMNPKQLSGFADGLYDRRAGLASFSKSYLAMAISNIQQFSSNRPKTLLDEARAKATYLDPATMYLEDGSGYWYFMNSNVRSTSIYMQALLKLDSKNADIERMLRYLVREKKDGHWETTQDNGMALLAIIGYAKEHPVSTAPEDIQLFINNELKETLKFVQGDISGSQERIFQLPDLLKKGVLQQLGLERDGENPYFYDLGMKVYRQVENIEPFDNGMTVTAEYFALGDKKRERPLREVKVGENVRVRLKLLVPKDRHFVALENHLPAGLEAISEQFLTSQKFGNENNYNGYDEGPGCVYSEYDDLACVSGWSYRWWWRNVWEHIELRDDRVFLFSEDLGPGVYEYEFKAQAVTPGEFRVPPARAYEFYSPSAANSHNEGKVFRVTR